MLRSRQVLQGSGIKMSKDKVKNNLQKKKQNDFTKAMNDIFKTSVSIRDRYNKL